jgi:cytidylate kinase
MKTHKSAEELQRLLKVRLQELRQDENLAERRPQPVLTVTREPGSGAEAIIEKLSAELGMQLYDWELVERIARDQKTSVRLVSSLEKDPPTWVEDYLAEFQPEYSVTSEAYLRSLKRVLLAIVVLGNAIIVGRGSNFFLPPGKKIGLCFIAPLAFRVENTMKDLGLTQQAARKHISEVEAEHRKLVKKYFQTDIRDPGQYHIVINTALVKPDTIVKLVKTMIEAENEKSQDPAPKQGRA